MKPSDQDLDNLLKAWTVPRSSDTLEGRVRRAYRDRTRWARWLGGFVPIAGKFAGALAGAVVLLAVIARAFPQSLPLMASPAAITMESEFLVYKDDGSYTVSESRTSSILDGRETILTRSFPGDPFRTAAGDVVNPVRSILDSIVQCMISPLFYKPGRAENARARAIALAARIRNGCTPANMWGRPMMVIGEETVLHYTTTVLRFSPEGAKVRFTEWFAPGLDCVSLRSTTETTQAAGILRLASEKRVVKVTTNSSRAAAKEAAQ